MIAALFLAAALLPPVDATACTNMANYWQQQVTALQAGKTQAQAETGQNLYGLSPSAAQSYDAFIWSNASRFTGQTPSAVYTKAYNGCMRIPQ